MGDKKPLKLMSEAEALAVIRRGLLLALESGKETGSMTEEQIREGAADLLNKKDLSSEERARVIALLQDRSSDLVS